MKSRVAPFMGSSRYAKDIKKGIEYGLAFNRLRGINFSREIHAPSFPHISTVLFLGMGTLYESGRVNLLHAPCWKVKTAEGIKDAVNLLPVHQIELIEWEEYPKSILKPPRFFRIF